MRNDISTHSYERLLWIENEMALMGVLDYRFTIENDCYICDAEGNVYSVCKRQLSRAGNPVEKYYIQKLHGSEDKYGYITYRITVNGVKKHIKGHRLVMNAWTGVNDELCVNHIDGNKHNNSLSNMEWCTVAENNAHAIKTGLFDPHGSRNFKYTIPFAYWITIYILCRHCGFSYSQLARMNGCVHDTIKHVVERVERVMPREVVNG